MTSFEANNETKLFFTKFGMMFTASFNTSQSETQSTSLYPLT